MLTSEYTPLAWRAHSGYAWRASQAARGARRAEAARLWRSSQSERRVGAELAPQQRHGALLAWEWRAVQRELDSGGQWCRPERPGR